MSDSEKIAFIGAGNMASSIIGGLIANGYNAAEEFIARQQEAIGQDNG